VNNSKIHRKDAKVQRKRKVNTLLAKAFFASPLPLCASAVGVKAFFHKLSVLDLKVDSGSGALACFGAAFSCKLTC